MSRPCERCGAGYSDYRNDESFDPMCSEVHIAHGIVSWLCFGCRQEWQTAILDDPRSIQYAELELAFEFWQWGAKKNPTPDKLAEGQRLFRELTSIEIAINKYAKDWLSPVGD